MNEFEIAADELEQNEVIVETYRIYTIAFLINLII